MPEAATARRRAHRLVVVDGSNLATEGRTTPSLAQLDDAVRSFAAEQPDAEIIVVVDASFGHRIDPSERETFAQAELHGELVSPPAGAIGRGDAFLLRIAERTGATVLSNDSFQEFHQEHPWLFEDGRLVGGKPVPGVGWIFTPRLPVRATRGRRPRGAALQEPSVEQAEGEEAGLQLPAAIKAAEVAKAVKRRQTRAAKPAPAAKMAKPAKASAAKATAPTADAGRSGASGGVRTARAANDLHVREAIAEAAAEVATQAVEPSQIAPPRRRFRSPPPPAVNEPLAFLTFVADHPIGSFVEGEVVSFTSHGAMVDVELPDGATLHCYVPLTAMADPPPNKAREVLRRGEHRPFVLVALDPQRRMADLALPERAQALLRT